MKTRTREGFQTYLEIAALVRRFESATLAKERWDHRAHLVVALWYLYHHDEPDAARHMIVGIQRYNHAHGIGARPGGGYHETLTMFWLSVVRAFMRAHAGRGFVTLSNALAVRFEGRKDLPLEFYTESRLWSAEARSHWIEPDLRSLADLGELV